MNPGCTKPSTLPADKMTLRFVIVIFLTGLNFYSYSQDPGDAVYVGSINGKVKADFIKEKSAIGKSIGLNDITESVYKIEVRLYETYHLAGLTFCTTLYLDSTFKVVRTKYWRFFDSTNYQPKESNTLNSIDPAKAFSVLIANGIFSLPNKKWNEILKESRPMEFRQKGLVDAGFLTVADGVSYTIEYKVDSFYNRVSFSNIDVYLKAYPDNQYFRRQYEIAKTLGAGFE
jgi:hypothetical protein